MDAVQHLRDYGTFSPTNRDRARSRSRRVLDLEPEILQAVEEEPNGCFQFHNLESAARTGITTYLQRVQHLKTRRSTTSNCILSMTFFQGLAPLIQCGASLTLRILDYLSFYLLSFLMYRVIQVLPPARLTLLNN
jgi:hypothetical protein